MHPWKGADVECRLLLTVGSAHHELFLSMRCTICVRRKEQWIRVFRTPSSGAQWQRNWPGATSFEPENRVIQSSELRA